MTDTDILTLDTNRPPSHDGARPASRLMMQRECAAHVQRASGIFRVDDTRDTHALEIGRVSRIPFNHKFVIAMEKLPFEGDPPIPSTAKLMVQMTFVDRH